MKVVIIGSNPRTVDIAKVSVRLRWPDASMQSCSTARKGLDLVEQEWPNIVVIHPDFKDSSLSAVFPMCPCWFWGTKEMRWRP